MRKRLLLLIVLLSTSAAVVKAQLLDATANANGGTTFNITTTHPGELIMISYDGWNGPGTGGVKVNGTPATLVSTANNGNSGSAMTYYYPAATAGTYTIVCTETGYNYSPYGINFAASVYATGCTLTGASITSSTVSTIACTTGGSVTGTITTTANKEFIYENCEINEGQIPTYAISFSCTSGTIADLHEGDGIDAAHGYMYGCTPATYTVTATNTSPPANGCGGLCLILTAISGGACAPATCTGCPAALPVSLLSFLSSSTDDGIELTWATATETGSDHYTLERSVNGVDFTPIYEVKAAGSSSVEQDYSFLDATPNFGINYYRLKETDKDGNEQTFHTTACTFDKANSEIYPNPNHGCFTIALAPSQSEQTIVVCDLLGKEVLREQVAPSSFISNYSVNLPKECKGVFISKVLSGGQQVSVKKVIVY